MPLTHLILRFIHLDTCESCETLHSDFGNRAGQKERLR